MQEFWAHWVTELGNSSKAGSYTTAKCRLDGLWLFISGQFWNHDIGTHVLSLDILLITKDWNIW